MESDRNEMERSPDLSKELLKDNCQEKENKDIVDLPNNHSTELLVEGVTDCQENQTSREVVIPQPDTEVVDSNKHKVSKSDSTDIETMTLSADVHSRREHHVSERDNRNPDHLRASSNYPVGKEFGNEAVREEQNERGEDEEIMMLVEEWEGFKAQFGLQDPLEAATQSAEDSSEETDLNENSQILRVESETGDVSIIDGKLQLHRAETARCTNTKAAQQEVVKSEIQSARTMSASRLIEQHDNVIEEATRDNTSDMDEEEHSLEVLGPGIPKRETLGFPIATVSPDTVTVHDSSETNSPITEDELDQLLEESLCQGRNEESHPTSKKRKRYENLKSWKLRLKLSDKSQRQDESQLQPPEMSWKQYYMYNNDACHLYRKLLLQLRALENARLRTTSKPQNELASEISNTQTELYELLHLSRWNGTSDGESSQDSSEDLAAEILATQTKLQKLLHQNRWNEKYSEKDQTTVINSLSDEVARTQMNLQHLLQELSNFTYRSVQNTT